MSKIYLCGITNKSEYKNIEELTDPIWEHIDGLIFGYETQHISSPVFTSITTTEPVSGSLNFDFFVLKF